MSNDNNSLNKKIFVLFFFLITIPLFIIFIYPMIQFRYDPTYSEENYKITTEYLEPIEISVAYSEIFNIPFRSH